jgi:hypothetical protein
MQKPKPVVALIGDTKGTNSGHLLFEQRSRIQAVKLGTAKSSKKEPRSIKNGIGEFDLVGFRSTEDDEDGFAAAILKIYRNQQIFSGAEGQAGTGASRSGWL